MQKILLAEDDCRLATLVKDYLEDNGFQVIIEERGDLVLDQIKQHEPDLIVLDVMLPNKDGLTVCKEARTIYQGPILILTARNEDIDQILGLEFGADDYVIKPAEPRILLARIRALLRRCNIENETSKDTLVFGKLTLNRISRDVHFNKNLVELSSHEFDLLYFLASQAGKVISREQLFNDIYKRPYDGLDRSIDVRISHLRKKLEDNTDTPFKIKTIWGKGYLFVPDAWH